MQLTINVEKTRPNIVTLKPTGAVDRTTSELLDNAVSQALEEPIRVLILDMGSVEFITSSGIGTIIKAKVSLARKGAKLALTDLQPQVAKVFEIIRLLPTLEVFRDRDELDEYLGRVQRRITGQDEA